MFVSLTDSKRTVRGLTRSGNAKRIVQKVIVCIFLHVLDFSEGSIFLILHYSTYRYREFLSKLILSFFLFF
jgi:hypothetical protein